MRAALSHARPVRVRPGQLPPGQRAPGRLLPGAGRSRDREPRTLDFVLALTAVVLLAVGCLAALSFLSA